MMNNLFEKENETVFKTEMTRKITINGITEIYPVYKIRLNELFYNDKNDRIATSIDSYNRTHDIPLKPGINEEYNKVIENFIVKSNEQAIFKTKNNIRLVGQREAGVVLPDGRIIDGNRRFTCLRQLSTQDEKFNFFEAIILPKDANAKQIKLLELMIQHGEEQRVEYDPIDMIVGIYHDIVETKMLTISEYAKAIDVQDRDVENKLKIADMIVEFLDFINMPKHWYLAKEFSIYTASSNVGRGSSIESLLKRCDEKYKDDLKCIIFTNITLNTSSKLIEILTKLAMSDLLESYIRHSKKLAYEFKSQLNNYSYNSYQELKNIINMNIDIKQELIQLLDTSFLKHKKNEVHSQPSKNVSKAVSMMKSIDNGVIGRLTEKESNELKQNVIKLNEYVSEYAQILDLPIVDTNKLITINENELNINKKNNFNISLDYIVPPIFIEDCLFESLIKTLNIKTFAKNFQLYFIDCNYNKISEIYTITSENLTPTIELNASASSLSECWLIIKHPEANDENISQIIKFNIKIIFSTKFDF